MDDNGGRKGGGHGVNGGRKGGGHGVDELCVVRRLTFTSGRLLDVKESRGEGVGMSGHFDGRS